MNLEYRLGDEEKAACDQDDIAPRKLVAKNDKDRVP